MILSGLTLSHFLPEALLAGGVLGLVLFGALKGDKSASLVTEIAIGLLGLAALSCFFDAKGSTIIFSGAFIDDAFGRFMKVLILGGSMATLMLAGQFLRRENIDKFEFPILVLLSTLGMLMLVSATSLMALYLGLELMSLALYVIAAFHRDNVKASEAGLKYFVLGALSSGMLLYGASLVYGFSGTVLFSGIAKALQGGQASIGMIFGLVFVMAGLAFKMSTVPFHMWTPDVYEGAPTPVTAFFASAAKIAAIAITIRIVMTAFPAISGQWQQIIAFLSIASMLLGGFAAIGQTNIKRLMAYSSIGHMGFALVGLAAGTQEGVQGVLIYMAIYLVMTLGTFAAILSMTINGQAVEKISDLSGLSKTNPTMAFFLMMMMFSLAGIPPLAGFFAKFYVFLAAIKVGLTGLSIIGMLASTVAAFYYIRIVKVMYFDAPGPAFDKAPLMIRALFTLASMCILLFWVFPAPVVNAATAAARSLF